MEKPDDEKIKSAIRNILSAHRQLWMAPQFGGVLSQNYYTNYQSLIMEKYSPQTSRASCEEWVIVEEK